MTTLRLICLALNLFNCVVGFANGNMQSGFGWLVAALWLFMFMREVGDFPMILPDTPTFGVNAGRDFDPVRMAIAYLTPDEPDFTPCQVPGCAEPLEYGQASLVTARCSQGHIWAELDGGEFQLINQWRV